VIVAKSQNVNNVCKSAILVVKIPVRNAKYYARFIAILIAQIVGRVTYVRKQSVHHVALVKSAIAICA